jgi:YHS domain-containing protein
MRTSALSLLAAVGLLAGLPLSPLPAQAEPGSGKTLINLDREGIALAGYDPVAYFTDHKAVEGNPAITSRYLGATYRFASKEHQALFESDAPKYVPQFGGYCGYGASRGYPAPVDPEAFVIMNGRLILQNSKSVLERWLKDPDAYLARADSNWPGIVKKHGKP